MSFLNSLLEKEGDEQIVGVELNNTEVKHRGDVKVFCMDLLCSDQKGHQYIVEMEKDIFKHYKPDGFFKRVQFYTAVVLADQLKKKARYEDLKPVVCLILTDSKPFPELPDQCISHHEIQERHSGTSYLKDMKWVFVELPKFSKPEGDLGTQMDEWLYLFSEGYKNHRLPITCSAALKDAYDKLDQSTWTSDERLAYIRWDIAQRDEEQKRYHAEETGREKGREEGLKKGREEGLEEGEKNGLYKSALAMVAGGMTDCEGAIKILKLGDELATRLRAETAAAGQKRPAGGETGGTKHTTDSDPKTKRQKP